MWWKCWIIKRDFIFNRWIYYENYSGSHVELDSRFCVKPDMKQWAVGNDFRFKRTVSNMRFSVRRVIAEGMNITSGVQNTSLHFDLRDKSKLTAISHLAALVNFNKSWENILNLSMSYRKTIRRPNLSVILIPVLITVIRTIRFGNLNWTLLCPHNLDVVVGKTGTLYYANLGVGYNVVQDIFSKIHYTATQWYRKPPGRTLMTGMNTRDQLVGRVYFSKKFRVNFSASYSFNQL